MSTITVRFHELDPYGHVNHAVYLNYFEQARVELLDAIGFGLPRLAELGYHFVVVDVHARFFTPAVAGDTLRVATDLVESRLASSRWEQRLLRDDTLLASIALRAGITDLNGRPTKAPAALVAAFEDLAARSAPSR